MAATTTLLTIDDFERLPVDIAKVAIYTAFNIRVLRGAGSLTTDLLPGFSIRVERLFQRP